MILSHNVGNSVRMWRISTVLETGAEPVLCKAGCQCHSCLSGPPHCAPSSRVLFLIPGWNLQLARRGHPESHVFKTVGASKNTLTLYNLFVLSHINIVMVALHKNTILK